MPTISFRRFKDVLAELNPRLRVYESRTTRNSMIYLANGNHALASELGLRELLGYPSPCYHYSFPKYDFLDVSGGLGRGYTTVFKMLVSKKLIDKKRLRMLIPDALDACRTRPKRITPDEKDASPVRVHSFGGKLR